MPLAMHLHTSRDGIAPATLRAVELRKCMGKLDRLCRRIHRLPDDASVETVARLLLEYKGHIDALAGAGHQALAESLTTPDAIVDVLRRRIYPAGVFDAVLHYGDSIMYTRDEANRRYLTLQDCTAKKSEAEEAYRVALGIHGDTCAKEASAFFRAIEALCAATPDD